MVKWTISKVKRFKYDAIYVRAHFHTETINTHQTTQNYLHQNEIYTHTNTHKQKNKTKNNKITSRGKFPEKKADNQNDNETRTKQKYIPINIVQGR